MADNRYKQVQAFNAPTAYDQQMVEARRRRRMAEALAQQAYVPQDVGVAPIPAAAPLVQGLQAFLSARAARKADEAEEKAGAAATRTGAELARLLTGGRLPETEAALTEVTPAGRIGPAKVEDLTEVAPAGRIGTAPTQDDIMRLAMTSGGVAAMKGNPLLAARLARTMETPDAEEYYAPVETTEGLVQFGKRGGKRATGMQAPERQKAEAMSGLGRLIAERNALPEGDPRRAVYDQAIEKETRIPAGSSVNITNIPPMNENQANAAGFADRIANALPVLESTSPGRGARILENAPLSMGNEFLSGGAQQFFQAERDFINSVLRRESGAVISEEEFVNARRQYIPQPGDKQEVLDQKRRNRQTVLRSMGRAAGPSYQAAPVAPPTAPAAPTSGKARRTASGVSYSILED
jgi:hypothetical protein